LADSAPLCPVGDDCDVELVVDAGAVTLNGLGVELDGLGVELDEPEPTDEVIFDKIDDNKSDAPAAAAPIAAYIALTPNAPAHGAAYTDPPSPEQGPCRVKKPCK
jgi:hypothetical protein